MLLIASVLCVVVLGWFSLRLKRDLDFMRRRLSKGKPCTFEAAALRAWVIYLLLYSSLSEAVLRNHSLSLTSLLHFNILLHGKFDCNFVVPGFLLQNLCTVL